MTKPVPLVVDASVVAKWYLLDEELQNEALSIHAAFDQGQVVLTMPDIARYEVSNTLSVAWRRGRLTQLQAQRALSDFLSWDFAYAGGNALILAAMHAARRLDCALYDALYIALAESVVCDLVTADRVLFSKVQAHAPLVRWLGDYAPPSGTRS